ncbi:MAG: ImmA/IrrE family metallo-endopeptidase [Sphingobium sp.]
MSGQDFIVPPRNWNAIEREANDWRKAFGLNDTALTPIMEMLEKVMDRTLDIFTLLVGEPAMMGSAEGLTDPKGEFIMLREDVYRGAWAGDVRDRFTAAHEFGHWALHTNVPLARSRPNEKIEAYRMSEPQANQFASALLMPKEFFRRSDSYNDVMDRHGVGFKAANNRLDYLSRKGLITK